MPNDPMPTGDGGTVATKHDPLLCEFCESKLTRRGQVIDLSEKARTLRKMQDTIERQKDTIETQAAEIARLSSELAAAKAAVVAQPADDDDDDDFFK